MSSECLDPRRRGWHALAILAGVMLLAGLGCSLATGVAVRSTATPAARGLRPTFTAAADQAGGSVTRAAGPIRGLLPPGVTALPVGTDIGQANRDTNLVLIATETPAPTGTGTATPLASATPRPGAGPSGPAAAPTPWVVVQASSAMSRRGPGPAYETLGEVRQGQQLMILGRTADSSWWQVCCIANQPGWVPANLVTAQGATGAAPILPLPPTPTPTFTATTAPTLTPSPTPLSPFEIARGPEFPIQRDDGTVVIWVKVYEDAYTPKPLAGYVLKVFRDGADVSLPAQSHNRSAGFDNTGPQQGSFEYNLKFEMPGGSEANWQIYLARPDGSRVSPISKFTTMGDSYRNLVVYIAYFLAR